MTFDINKYATEIANAEFDRVDREFLEPGSHIIEIQGTVCVNSSNTGNDLIILEGVIVSSNTMPNRELVKHIWQLSGCEKWKTQRNLNQLKTVVVATLPPEIDTSKVTPDIVARAFNEDQLFGAWLKVIVKKKTSKQGKEYLDYSFVRCEQPEVTPEEAQEELPNNGWPTGDAQGSDDDESQGNIPF